ncbi:Uncharacterised protein [Mycobacteroides abscessus subsp. bolletii]|uniref:hypothetical protein n=1 Tax=Mycobacteroides abscessus TaxID=36809 RepID=UPI000928EBD3|nr:hypothetical protein [Mycobacteroides abscessus]SHQ49341.1 Uncharacterised protein [Mycobacteroides abscessus subsp. bolletii]SHR50866.1 Uncharacterised protein [Mycobacteroides abscessus subsp. bolletii]SHS34019.1 Uncharacterised protein [Mycobacteroides abscessus subsp. bolletii]SHT01991.1 Uncharacterised protein [Mycobacteroides abscessus subsp. bolletii]SHX99404.1 Uncharacterised protein [Mycobacteroides abscessus subsp. bolletii]
MSMNPPLDAARLSFAAALLDSAVGHIKRIVEDEQFDASRGRGTLPGGESERLDVAGQCIGWLAEEFRRQGIKLVAVDQAMAGRFTGEPQVPDTPAAFAASISRPGPPTFPHEPIQVAAAHDRMDAVRGRLNEASGALTNGQGGLTRAALEQVQFLHQWCSGNTPQGTEESSLQP